ncbi:hypothetical protein [uncultured Hymenobacter sp.]|uniref:hypothetical protein n=1 Tax=uncultured Hymenobacter sp. TaxID=170016 RepID=UPI0035C9D379
MKSSLLYLLLGLGLTGCKEDTDSATGLAGTWQLTSRVCFCPEPLPNQAVTFTDTSFSFYENGQLTRQGTYAAGMGTFCGGTTEYPVTKLTYSLNPSPELINARITLTDNELTLDFGKECDAPFNTYRRLPSSTSGGL